MNESNKLGQKWYGAVWFEFFVALILARILNYTILPNTSFVILLPIMWLIVYLIFGKLFKKAENLTIPGTDRLDDLFNTKKKDKN